MKKLTESDKVLEREINPMTFPHQIQKFKGLIVQIEDSFKNFD